MSLPEFTRPSEVVRAGLCIGCGACAAQTGGTLGFDRFAQQKPQGEWADRPNPSLAGTCPFSATIPDEDQIAAALFPAPARVDGRIGRFQAAYVGAVAEGEYRANGSSGGMVSWVAAELLRLGLVDGVAHVAPGEDGRFFAYRISRTPEQISEGAKSRYYPVEMSGVLAEIAATPGRYAIVGVPCFIKAVNLLRRNDPVLRERIAYTLGLFCGHMKSARLVESFAWQLGAPLEEVERPEYRLKNPDRPASWYTAHLTLKDGTTRQQDWWHLCDGDWGAGFFMNAPCNLCDDVMAETADIAFGDAWVEPYSSDGRGTNVVVVRAPELHAILDEAIDGGRLDLSTVDADFIAGTQAAGLRQRREGLAYRLTWRRYRHAPPKRVAPSADLPFRRKLVYRLRHHISAGSHHIARIAHVTGRPEVYLRWAGAMLGLYAAVTYGRGRLGAMLARMGLRN